MTDDGVSRLEAARPTKRAFQMVLGALLALVLAEIAVRYFYSIRYVYDSELGYLHAPGSTRRTGESPPAVSTWTVDGIRHSTPPDERPRILVLGDSYTEALMIDDDDVYTHRLQVELPQYQFLNVGRSTVSVADYVALAEVYKRRLHPRWTIAQIRTDDLEEDAFDQSERTHFTILSNGDVALQKIVPPHKTGPTYRLRDWSMLAYFSWVRYSEWRLAMANEPPLFGVARAAPTSRRQIDYPIEHVMDRFFEAYDGRATLALIASYSPTAPDDLTATERRILERCAARSYSCTSTRSGYRRFATVGRAPFGFATSAFNEGHLNAEGHALLGAVIAEELRRIHAVL